WFLDDMAALGAREPDHMPRATQYIPQMVTMIEELIAGGHAYEAEGHVLFAVESYSKYGALSGRTVKDMIAGSRVEVAPYKRNPMDFVLWKPSTGDQPGWESPWGFGRPGWHIECSAMAYELLGESFDIHGGGNDLMFPHHENEIAQSCCAHPHGDFARYWMHNEMLQVEGRKMSKSLGNFFTVRDLLDQGVPGEVIRFVFLSTHYRKPMDWTVEKARQARDTLTKWHYMAIGLTGDDLTRGEVLDDVIAALANDLNTHGAMTVLNRVYNEALLDRLPVADFVATANFLGFLTPNVSDWFIAPVKSGIVSGLSEQVPFFWIAEEIANHWNILRNEKEFARADALKASSLASGLELTALQYRPSANLSEDANFDELRKILEEL
ncbi:MAG TPA: cysteine--tRNA ligase, partial [Rhodobacteraceae bacterium]|nr:cysteine--tRNA ligase [Paracoccaceae bacterium]